MDEPQVMIIKEQNKITVSADFKTQPAPYESVGAFRSYTHSLQPGENEADIERALIEQAVAIASLVVDIQLAVNYHQEPRYQEAWDSFGYLCPDKFKPYLGLASPEESESVF